MIFLSGLWSDLIRPNQEEVFVTGLMVAVPYFILCIPLGWLYFHLHKHIKSGFSFYIKEIFFAYIVCFCLYPFSLLNPFSYLVYLLFSGRPSYFLYIVSQALSIFAPKAIYLFIAVQVAAVALLIITVMGKKRE